MVSLGLNLGSGELQPKMDEKIPMKTMSLTIIFTCLVI